MPKYKVWQNAWKDGYDEPLEIDLPDDWKVTYHGTVADTMPPSPKELIRDRIRNPIDSKTLKQLARHGSEAVIVFDDLSRGTPVKEIAEVVLEELEENGIDKDHIRFICALGTHGAMTRVDFVRKLGKDIVENYAVYNHNAFGNLVEIGKDRDGEPVLINREFMECDVRIGIGSVSPHPMNGFGGGGKILFPGIAGAITTKANHGRGQFTKFGTQKNDCGFRTDIESMTSMVGSFFKIDAVINDKLQIVDIYAGNPLKEYYFAAASSGKVNALTLPENQNNDVVIVNANAKYNEALISVKIASQVLKKGGDIVLINHCETGQVVHYTFGPFGKNSGGTLFKKFEERPKMKCGRLIFYTPFPDHFTKAQFDEPEKVVLASTWEEVLRALGSNGEGTSAAVISDGSISYWKQ